MKQLAWLAKLIKENHKVVIQGYSLNIGDGPHKTNLREDLDVHIGVSQICIFKFFGSEYPNKGYFITTDSDLNNILRKEGAKLSGAKTYLLSIIYKKGKDNKTIMEVRTDMRFIYDSLEKDLKAKQSKL